jgi:linker histone H1 and H5 family
MPYRKLILKAVEELRDSNMRSSQDAIYRFVESHIPNGVECNYPLFLTDLKAMAEDGILEINSTHCSFSADYKKKRVAEMHARTLLVHTPGPDLNVWMNDVSDDTPRQRNADHIKHKGAIRRVLSSHKYPR